MGKRESRNLQTFADVMSALGGPEGVRCLTGAAYKRVWDWERDRQFPSKYHALMSWALSLKGLRAPPALWGQVTTPEMEKAAA